MGQYLDSRPLPGGHYLAGLAGCPRSTAQEVRCDADVCTEYVILLGFVVC